MTTLVRARLPLESLSMNQQPQRRQSARLRTKQLEYDQQDGDFQFTRGSKRKKTEPELEPVPEPPKAAPPKRKPQDADRAEPQDSSQVPRKKPRRQMNFDTPKKETESSSAPKRATRRTTRSSLDKARNDENAVNGSSSYDVEDDDDDRIEMVGVSQAIPKEKPRPPPRAKPRAKPRSPPPAAIPAPVPAPALAPAIAAIPAPTPPPPVEKVSDVSSHEGTKIALAFSDTPIINRNKDMRKKQTRRSSVGLRGRRASSLIDNGYNATPHKEVESSEFYKLIEEGLLEPRRMKQLLVWCGERALGDKPGHGLKDGNAVMGARAIMQGLLKDFSNRPEMSDWFSREEAPAPPVPVIKKPNPINEQNAEKIKELEARIEKLKAEHQQWISLTTAPSFDPLTLPPPTTDPSNTSIDPSLLDPEDASILASLRTTHSSAQTSSLLSTRLSSLTQSLEFKIDTFADGVHKLEQYRNTLDTVAGKVLALSAVRDQDREKKEKESVGTRDLPVQEVFRALSRILPPAPMGGVKDGGVGSASGAGPSSTPARGR